MTRFMRYIGFERFKALKSFAIRIVARLTLAAGVAVIILLTSTGFEAVKAFASKPGSIARPTESIVLEILGAGLEKYFDDYKPARIHYRIYNSGPPRKITLGLEQGEKVKGAVPKFLKIYGEFRLRLDIPAGATREGKLIVPYSWNFAVPKTQKMLVARDLDGEILARANLLNFKSGSPVLILARGPMDAARIQTALLFYVFDKYGSRPDVFVPVDRAPTNWYDYQPAKLVVIARKWSELESAQRKALLRWLSIGGKLVISPRYCPDWRLAPWGKLSKTGGRYGIGEVYIIPAEIERGDKGGIDEKTLGGWFINKRLLFSRYLTQNGLELTHHYTMPGTWMLALFILAIVLMVGPAMHFILLKVEHREWAWVAVPGLSLFLALSTYVVTSRVKGQGTVLEVRHLIKIFKGVSDAAVATSARVLSPIKQDIFARLSADDPSLNYSYKHKKIFAELIHPDGIDISDISMQRFSIKDFKFISFIENPPSLKIRPAEKSAVVKNIGAGELKDVFFYVNQGWIPVAPILKQGQQTVVGPFAKAVNINKLEPDWPVEGGMESLKSALREAMSQKSDLAIVARCGSRGFPSLTIKPAPDLMIQSVICVWLKWNRKGAKP